MLAQARAPHHRHLDRRRPAERHRLLRLHLAARDRRRLRLPHHSRIRCCTAVEALAASAQHLARRLGGEGDRPARHLRLRVLQVRLVVPALQLHLDPDRRGPVRGGARDAESAARVDRAAHMSILAGHHFSLGQRAFFFSVGFLGWFASAWLFLAITLAVSRALPAAVRLSEAGLLPRRLRAARLADVSATVHGMRDSTYIQNLTTIAEHIYAHNQQASRAPDCVRSELVLQVQ